MERLFNRAKERLLLDELRLMGSDKACIRALLCFTAMPVDALAAVEDGKPLVDAECQKTSLPETRLPSSRK